MLGNTMINIIKAASKAPPGESADLIFGDVTSINPLIVKLENGTELEDDFLIKSALVIETWINVPTHEEVGHIHPIPATETDSKILPMPPPGPHKHPVPAWETELALPKIKLWRGLKTGDKVLMIRLNRGQLFYIIQREEGITNDAEE